jgi:uncharacterized membrane protein YgcG
MKKICLMVCAVLFCASLAFGDEVEESLSTLATEQLKNSTREMITSGIDADNAIRMTKLMLKNQFSLEQTLRAQKVIMNAQKDGLPVEPIMNKAYEGMVKQVQAKNIVQAMEQVHSRYAFAHEQARALTKERSQVRAIGNTIAKGLAAGMNQEDIGGITNRLRVRTQQMTQSQTMELAKESFKTARDMTRLGLSSKATNNLVCLALQNGYTARKMENMRNSFMTQSLSSPLTHLANSYSNAIKGGKSVDSLGYSGSSGLGGLGGPGGPGAPGGSGGGGGSGGRGGGKK